jgi:dienelactone hydrolase
VTSRGAAVALAVVVAGWASASALTSIRQPAFRLRVLRLVDNSRRAHFRNGTSGPRVLVTDVRVPTGGQPPFPLVVFGHGFALTPRAYAHLLDTWASAGYVVAAPVFPVESENAPGGPDESDLVNQPGDISFVVSSLTAPTGPLHGLVDSKRIALAGQSDGAETAFAASYDRRYLDRRVDAAVIMSGTAFPGFTGPARSPPLLAIQGTRDQSNSPSTTAGYYRLMHRPKFLLWLLGATHLPPYTTRDRWAAAVDRATLAFLDHYLRGRPLRPLLAPEGPHGTARIVSDP